MSLEFNTAQMSRELGNTEILISVDPETLHALGALSVDYPDIFFTAIEQDGAQRSPIESLAHVVGGNHRIRQYPGDVVSIAQRMFGADSSEFPMIVSSVGYPEHRLAQIGEFMSDLYDHLGSDAVASGNEAGAETQQSTGATDYLLAA